MGIAELETELDISFHDSLLRTLSADFAERTAEFVLDVCVGHPGAATESERERRRTARLELAGLEYLVVDPPDPKYPYRAHEPVDIDPCAPDLGMTARYPLPQGAFAGRFFVSDWNAFIHFAAMQATVTWLEPEMSFQGAPNPGLEPTAITRPRLNPHRYPDLLSIVA